MPRRVRTLTVDLHGFDVVSALDLAVRRVAEAQANGYETVELLHGAADVVEPVEAGRGRIKWELRQMARQGAFDHWVRREDTWEKAASLVLALRANGRARREGWSEGPRPRYR